MPGQRMGADGSLRELRLDGVTLVVTTAPGGSSSQLIAEAVSRVLGIDVDEVLVSHHCDHCGASDHGRPAVSLRHGDPSVSVSFSRTGRYRVAAARVGAPIGVDIESVAAVARHPVDDVLLHPAERQALRGVDAGEADRFRARLWVAKEAVLKRSGTGLRADLRDLRIELDVRPGLTVFDLDADVVGALATS